MIVKKFYRRSFLLVLLAFSSVFAWSQQQAGNQSGQSSSENQEQEGFKIRAEVNMVNVPVTVRRPEGGFIKGLPQSAFQIFEDGQPQEIAFFAQEGLPTRIAIVLDVSGSVRSEWGKIKYATERFVEHLKPEDQFSLITFNSEIRLKMDWGRNTDRVDAVLTSIYCKDTTKLWDAIWVACRDAFKGVTDKKAIIIMSDGMDNDSIVSYDDALQEAIRSEAAVYVVSKTEAVRQIFEANKAYYASIPEQAFVQADLVLRKLAYETGGRVLYPNTFGQLDNIYAQVDEELRNQYTLGYISTNTIKDGSYRRIEVRVKAPNAVISARPGYYAPDGRGSRSAG
jgi:Ca-activated chloride channel family protein